ncbi:MAG: hypothetical protein HY319_25910 [Armatimonadetes bacterium]|nr:hypothetical protein [Armatimonadota bacterium]
MMVDAGADDEPLAGVRRPSTGRRYHLRVPPATERCSEAVAWTFGFSAPTEFRPLRET